MSKSLFFLCVLACGFSGFSQVTKHDQVILGNRASMPSFANLWIEGSPNPQVLLNSLNPNPNERLWAMSVVNDEFRIFTEKDDFSQVNNAFVIKRGTGLSIDRISFPEGNVGIGADPFDGVKTYIFQDRTTAPTYGSSALFAFNSISHTSGEQSKVRGAWVLSLNGKSGVLNESMGIDLGAGNESSATGTVKNAYGINIDVQKGNGTVNNGYGIFIKRVQGDNTYGIYQQGDVTKNYFEGNVGIGTASPEEKLHINGSIRGNASGGALRVKTTAGYLDLGAQNTSWAHIYTDRPKIIFNKDVHTTTNAFSSYNNDLILKTKGTERLRINDVNGNVGIGTTNPTEKLHIQEGNMNIYGYNTSRYIRFTETNLQGGFINYDGSSNVLNIGVNNINSSDANNDYNSISIMRSTGNVGIGTVDTKGYKLGVQGKIAAEEVKVALYNNWPDYVFEDTYSLPTLEQVENHITTKGHLFNIPSAAEVTENGIELGAMNAKLLEKIEELTLYTIAQEKKIEKLKSENDQQSTINNQLKTNNQNLEARLAKIEALLEKE